MAYQFATADDLAARWRPLTAAEQNTANVLLGDASLMLLAEYPGLDTQVQNGGIDGGIPQAVAVAMVKRAMLSNGGGVSQESESIGPYSHSTSYANPAGNLYITATEDRFIRGYKPGAQTVNYNNDTINYENMGPGYVYGPWFW